MLKIGLMALGLVMVASVSRAADAPSLTGTWTGTAELINKQGRATDEVTVEITEQQGATFVGRVLYRQTQEEFVGTVAPDGRTVHWVDSDGHSSGTLTAPDTMEICYVEIGGETEAACVVLKRGS